MNAAQRDSEAQALAERLDARLAALSLIAGYYRIAADPAQLRRQLALTGRLAGAEDLIRAANLLQLKSRVIRGVTAKRLGAIPYPAILALKDGGFTVLAVAADKGKVRLEQEAKRALANATAAANAAQAPSTAPGQAESFVFPGNPCTPASWRLSAVRPKVAIRPIEASTNAISNGSNAQIPAIHRQFGEQLKSTHSARSRLVLWTGGKGEKAVVG
jgi:hypothetical protein